MTETPSISTPEDLNSQSAISAPVKEKIRMQAQRYQKGSLSIVKRKSQPDVWVFRYYVEEASHRTYKKQIIGTVVEFPKRRDAEKAVLQLRVQANNGADFAPLTVEQLVTHYRNVEFPLKAPSTRAGYKDYLEAHILPKWGQHLLAAVKSVDVESWLRTVNRLDGKPASPSTKTKIRNLMSSIFSHAIRYEWAAKNPISSVRTSSRRMRDPDILAPEEFQALLLELPQRERVMVLLAGSTGLRRGELIALRWGDIDFEIFQANITHSIWRNIDGNTKTAASRRPVPLPAIVVEELKRWRETSIYNSADDYLFPSVAKNGERPLAPDMVLKRHIRAALKRIGVTKQIGWHTFRHTLGTMLRLNGVDLKVAQELLRHANPRTTMDLYQQTVGDEKRLAQGLAFGGLLGGSSSLNVETALSAPSWTLAQQRSD